MKKPFKNNFIYQTKINSKLCKDIIKYFHENEKNIVEGHVAGGIIKEAKESYDLSISYMLNDYPFCEYKNELQRCINEYMKIYPDSYNLVGKYGLIKDYNIQYYKPKTGFKVLHCERSTKLVSTRILVFMTYLNTVKNAGTYFPNQKFTSECVIGNTLIWPAEWTHAHKGVINTKKDKYIITGWFDFV